MSNTPENSAPFDMNRALTRHDLIQRDGTVLYKPKVQKYNHAIYKLTVGFRHYTEDGRYYDNGSEDPRDLFLYAKESLKDASPFDMKCELATGRPNIFLQEVLVQLVKVSIQDIDSTNLIGKQIGEALDAKRLEVIRECIRNASLLKG